MRSVSYPLLVCTLFSGILTIGCGREDAPERSSEAAVAADNPSHAGQLNADSQSGNADVADSEVTGSEEIEDLQQAPPESVSPSKPSPPPEAITSGDDSGEGSPRMLPPVPDASGGDSAAANASNSNAGDATADAAGDAAPSADQSAWKREGPTAEELAAKAFAAPPGATSLSKDGRLWIDPKRKRVYVDGYVTLKQGALEMFACPAGTKEHESIVAVLSKSRDVHAALLAIGANPGTPVRFQPEYLPPTGQVIRVFVCWYDQAGKFHTIDAREWIEDLQTKKAMTAEWVFAGSGFWQDPDDKREHYLADSGDMICVSNFSSAMLDVAIPSSADTGSLRFVPMESKIPELNTPVRMVLVSVPNPTDTGPAAPIEPPAMSDVPRSK